MPNPVNDNYYLTVTEEDANWYFYIPWNLIANLTSMTNKNAKYDKNAENSSQQNQKA